jgi:hypothetical protein
MVLWMEFLSVDPYSVQSIPSCKGFFEVVFEKRLKKAVPRYNFKFCGIGKRIINKYQPFIESIHFCFLGIDRPFELRVESTE